MKIAVLTFNIGTGYGGILQAYAMLEALKQLGHEPELLYLQSKSENSFKNFVKKYFLSYFTNRWVELQYEDIIFKNLFKFIDKYVNPKTKPLTIKDFEIIEKNNYDVYIVGSDQVWNPGMYKYLDQAFFGFVKSDKPILLSYAASFGVNTWEYTEKDTLKFKNQIQRFKGVSVREDSGVELCRKYFEKDAVHVLDPTMLLSADHYRKIIQNENEPSHDGEFLNYILDASEEKIELINMIATELNMEIFKINAKAKKSHDVNDLVYPTVTSWLKGFDDAKYVITDSFHGTVFAIIFNKPFLVYGNQKRGMARFESLLKILGLEDRLVLSKKDVSIEKIRSEIDWESVNSKLEEYKKSSKRFLINNMRI